MQKLPVRNYSFPGQLNQEIGSFKSGENRTSDLLINSVDETVSTCASRN